MATDRQIGTPMSRAGMIVATTAILLSVEILPAASAQAATTTTKHCSTGGYSYTADSMYVSRTYLGSSQWRYKVTRSRNRTVTAQVNGSYHYVTHKAVALNQYTRGTVKKVTNPPTTVYLYSRSGADDFGIWFNVSDGGVMNLHKGCYVRF